MGKWIKLSQEDGATVALKYISGYERFIDATVLKDSWKQSLQTATPHGRYSVTSSNTNPTGASGSSFTATAVEPLVESFETYYNSVKEAAGNFTLRKPNSGNRVVYLEDPLQSNEVSNLSELVFYLNDPLLYQPTSFTPQTKLIDAYELVDVYVLKVSKVSSIITRATGTFPEDPGAIAPPTATPGNVRIQASGYEGYAIAAVVVEPGDAYGYAAKRTVSTAAAFDYVRAPRAKTLVFSTHAWEPYEYDETFYAQPGVNTPPNDPPNPPVPVLDLSSVSASLDYIYDQLNDIFGPF